MKKFILYISFVLAAFTATAQLNAEDRQVNPKREEKIKALYTAYISQQLALTSAEAEKFWPTHAQYQAELMSVNRNETNELDRQQGILNVKKKYQGTFNKILGAERSNSFYKQDDEFRKKLVERLKQMRQQRGNNKQGGFQRSGKQGIKNP